MIAVQNSRPTQPCLHARLALRVTVVCPLGLLAGGIVMMLVDPPPSDYLGAIALVVMYGGILALPFFVCRDLLCRVLRAFDSKAPLDLVCGSTFRGRRRLAALVSAR